MKLTLPPAELAGYVSRQMYHLFPDVRETEAELLPLTQEALERLDHCFSHMNMKYSSEKITYYLTITTQITMLFFFIIFLILLLFLVQTPQLLKKPMP